MLWLITPPLGDSSLRFENIAHNDQPKTTRFLKISQGKLLECVCFPALWFPYPEACHEFKWRAKCSLKWEVSCALKNFRDVSDSPDVVASHQGWARFPWRNDSGVPSGASHGLWLHLRVSLLDPEQNIISYGRHCFEAFESSVKKAPSSTKWGQRVAGAIGISHMVSWRWWAGWIPHPDRQANCLTFGQQQRRPCTSWSGSTFSRVFMGEQSCLRTVFKWWGTMLTWGSRWLSASWPGYFPKVCTLQHAWWRPVLSIDFSAATSWSLSAWGTHCIWLMVGHTDGLVKFYLNRLMSQKILFSLLWWFQGFAIQPYWRCPQRDWKEPATSEPLVSSWQPKTWFSLVFHWAVNICFATFGSPVAFQRNLQKEQI